jgi:hypothetical protein
MFKPRNKALNDLLMSKRGEPHVPKHRPLKRSVAKKMLQQELKLSYA